MLRYGKTKTAKKEFYGAKKLIKSWDVNVGYVVTSKLFESKSKTKY